MPLPWLPAPCRQWIACSTVLLYRRHPGLGSLCREVRNPAGAQARIALSRAKITYEENEIARAEQVLTGCRSAGSSGTLHLAEGSEFFINDNCTYKAVITRLRHYPRFDTYSAEVDASCLSEESWVKDDTLHLSTSPGYIIEHKRFWPEIIRELRSSITTSMKRNSRIWMAVLQRRTDVAKKDFNWG